LNLNLQSRIHRLQPPFEAVFVKRDDELSSSISGSKIRKYASLILFLKSEGFTDVLLLGGFRSNHVIGCAQLLKENRLTPHVFFEEGFAGDLNSGNHLLSHLLFKPEEI